MWCVRTVHWLFCIYAWLSVYFSCSNCMRRCALFIRCTVVHSLYMCISHANSLFFNQPTKYRHQSGTLFDQQRWEQSSSSSLSSSSAITQVTHLSTLSTFSYSSFVDGLIILDIRICIHTHLRIDVIFDSIYKQQLTLWVISFFYLACIHTSKFGSWTF